MIKCCCIVPISSRIKVGAIERCWRRDWAERRRRRHQEGLWGHSRLHQMTNLNEAKTATMPSSMFRTSRVLTAELVRLIGSTSVLVPKNRGTLRGDARRHRAIAVHFKSPSKIDKNSKFSYYCVQSANGALVSNEI